MQGVWRSERYSLFLLLLVSLILARLTGSFFFALCVSTIIYLAHHLLHIRRLLQWLQKGQMGHTPHASGIWEEIYYLIFKLRRRNRRRKKQLLRMLDRFRTATAALPDATVILGNHDEIDWFNDAAAKLLNLRREDLGQPVTNLIRHPRFTAYLRNAHESATVNLQSPNNDAIQLEIRIVPYGEDSRLLIAQDVTQIRFMERVRSDFVANVSHELRTPLTVIRGYVETLSDMDKDEPLPARYGKIFQRVEQQTARMQQLIDDLLALTRLESGEIQTPHPVNIPDLLQSLCEDFDQIPHAHAAISLELESESGLSGNEADLRSAISNLILNAIKYTPADGKIQVRWSVNSKEARIDIADNGPGIPREHIPRLTERFYRVDGIHAQSRPGTGLGLAIVKHALLRHDGELKIESRLGKGSCFTCCFPLARVTKIAEKSIMAHNGEF